MTFAVLASTPARDALDILREHPEVNDPTTGLEHIAAFERGEVVYRNSGPVEELNAIIDNALYSDNCSSVAYFRSIMDGWDNTPFDLLEQVRMRWPNFEHIWGAFIATGVAAVSPVHPIWLQFPPLDDNLIDEIAGHLSLGEYAGRAFLHALNDMLGFTRSTECLGIVTARNLGPSLNDSDYSID